MRCQFVEAQRTRHGVGRLCAGLRISRSAYYAWRVRPPSRRAMENARLLREMRRIHREADRTYGSPRMRDELSELGLTAGKHRIARLMRQDGLYAKHNRKYKHTTKSGHKLPVSPNLVRQRFEMAELNQTWVSDITYLWTMEGWLYLAVILDLCSRRIVGWATSHRINKELVCDAMRQALRQRGTGTDLILHSDQGSQYASNEYQMLLRRNGVRSSMSDKGNCYDNAVAESFFATLKRERISHRRYATREEANRDLFDYIEVFYNRRRRHSSIGGISPVLFEERLKCA